LPFTSAADGSKLAADAIMSASEPGNRRLRWTWLGVSLLAFGACRADVPREPGLLFYLSGARGTDVDFSGVGTAQANFARGVSQVADGAKGPGLHCESTQVLSYWAPGNIYAERGTLAFFWRSHDAVGPTEFPVFRVGYADHSSWDMVWLRIDYNGHGFDAFVTDANLARVRVSVSLPTFPSPETWTHLALAWDETSGIRFYVNGKLAAQRDGAALLDAGLDQFGPHSRIISPHNVQSDYNFVRGGDIDELSIYDRMLDDASVAALARGEKPKGVPPLPARRLNDPRFRDEWWWRYGWNGAAPPPYFAGANLSVRKVEIHDAYDLGRWWWKANDGIRETTWPGVYNRSKLPGRLDYFTLPDWDCYSTSGRRITFTLPDERWNYLAIEGAAPGKVTLLENDTARDLFERPKGKERTFYQLDHLVVGQQIRFDSAEPEQPIAELSAMFVDAGTAPADDRAVDYRLVAPNRIPPALTPLLDFIDRRYPPDERALLVADPVTSKNEDAGRSRRPVDDPLPVVHVLIPPAGAASGSEWNENEGLDGIVLDLPPLDVRPTHGDRFPLNIQVKDPLWPPRNLLDFTWSLHPGEGKSLWLDLRDRILPPGKPLYIAMAGAGGDFGADALFGARLRLLFKPRSAARKEHEIDRFTEARDAYAMLVEESPHDPRFNLWNRFKGDLDDLLRVNPDHELGRIYAALSSPGTPRPPFTQPEPPAGVPRWAFRQVTALAGLRRLILYYIDHRQLENGELGGGISDDTDLTNIWPGAALMGCQPEKLRASLRRLLEACYANGMLDRGLPVIQTDELHGYEEGINAIAQNLLLDYGSPKLLERAMENARSVAGLTGVNAAGHRHFRTSYYSATRVAEDSVWGYSKQYMTLLLHPSFLLVDYNGSPTARRTVIELADGLLAHRHPDDKGRFTLPRSIHFASDRESSEGRDYFPWPLFWAAFQWTGERRYLEPIFDRGLPAIRAVNADLLDRLGVRETWRASLLAEEGSESTEDRPVGDVRGRQRGNEHRSSSSQQFAWQLTGDKRYLESLYGDAIEETALREYVNTEGSIWIDRVVVPHADLERARLGGVALVRNGTFPGHVVSWTFEPPGTETSVAILVPLATPQAFDVIAYNLDTGPVRATMTAWNIDPGQWEVLRGVDTNDDDVPDRDVTKFTTSLERGESLALTLPPRVSTVLHFRLKTAGKPYWSRPDLGIDGEDVSFEAAQLRIRVHSLGAVAAPEAELVFRTASGRVASRAKIPALAAPDDLSPKTVDVALPLPPGIELSGGTVELDPDDRLRQITRRNDRVTIRCRDGAGCAASSQSRQRGPGD